MNARSHRIENSCPACGSPTPDGLHGQCPRCLINVALSPEELDTPEDADGDEPRLQLGGYTLDRQIGAGGMGIVYAARRCADGQRVAVKLIRDFQGASPTALRRFTIEAEAAARLDHPHIVRVHEVGECDGQPFLAMDYIDGESLGAHIADSAFRPSQTEVALLMAKVARAAHHAHTRGVLHRDLKPANILLDRHGEPHLTDFGLAKIGQRQAQETNQLALTATGDAPGTPGYMSPEQVARGEIGVASDIYGLGAVLYALLTRQPPFRGVTPLELFQRIVEQPPEKPRTSNPAVAPALETICLKCLEKEPGRRYLSAEALAEDLENFAHDRPITARRASLGSVGRQWMQRNPIGAAFIATLCLGLGVALALLKIVNEQRHEIQLDRDQAFDDSMQRVSQIWRDPATRSVTISARELAILAGRSVAEVRDAEHQLVFGISADDGPSSMAQRYAHLLGIFESHMRNELNERVAFHLRLFKRFSRNDDALIHGESDVMVLSAAEFMRAKDHAPGIMALALANTPREGVLFARADRGIVEIRDLAGKSIVFPDAGLSATAAAKARLFATGIAGAQLKKWTNLSDRAEAGGEISVSTVATVQRVLAGEFDAGVTHRGQFERSRHLGLVLIEVFPETPHVLAARPGLSNELSQALRNAIRSTSSNWPENKFVAESMNNTVASRLESFPETLRKADRFERE